MTTATSGLKKWEVGQTVEVQSRTWAGINREGGCGRIIKIHYSEDGVYVEGLDVKYTVSGQTDKNIDPAIVSPFETLERGGRKRRGREFLMEMVKDGGPLRQRDENMKPPPSKKKTTTTTTTTSGKKKSVKRQSTKGKWTKEKIKKQDSSSGNSSRNVHPASAVFAPLAAAAAAVRPRGQAGEADISLLSATAESPSHTTTSKNRKKETAATKANQPVKPVPAFVIADREVHVSPLPTHDRLIAMSKKKKNNNNDISSSTTTTSSSNKKPAATGNVTAARRGLFGSSGNDNKNSFTTAPAAKAKSQAPPRIQPNHGIKSIPPKDMGRAIPPSLLSTPPKSSNVPATKARRAPEAKTQPYSSNDDARRLAKKKHPVYNNNRTDKPILELPRPRQQRTTDDHKVDNGKTKSLKEVHEDCVKSASNFCNDVIYPSSSIGATAAKENNKNRSSSAIAAVVATKKKPPPCLPKKNEKQDEEKQRRLAIFRILRKKAEDGMIEESDLRKVLNSTTDTRPYSDDEINQHLEKLYKDEKIMRSDGTVYIID